MNKTLEGKVTSTKNLTESHKLEMFKLLQENFEGYIFNNFLKDLKQKEDVILLQDEKNSVKGFTTIQNINIKRNEEKIRGLYSGDTIIQKEYWNKHDLFKVWLNYAFEKKEKDNSPLYWFLISSGCRTYKIIPTFFNNFYPKFDETNKDQKELLDIFGKYKFGTDYESNTGLITFSNSLERLNPHLAKIDKSQMKNQHVAYFLEKNPEYYKGKELACIVEISKNNLRSFGFKLLSK